jgi:hypothetical protein
VQDAYRLGGWGMYPTTFFGLVLLFFAIQYVRHPARRRMLVVRHLNILTMLSATLGFVTGCIKTFTCVPREEMHLAVVGVGESLNNIGLGLCMLVLARIIVTFGAARDADSASELVDPRAP